MPNPDDGGYTPHRFQVYINGNPFGPVFPTDGEAQAIAAEQRENCADCDIEIVALGDDQDPKYVVIPGYGPDND